MQIAHILLVGLGGLSNPVTPWVVLGLTTAGWLTAYVLVSGGRDGE